MNGGQLTTAKPQRLLSIYGEARKSICEVDKPLVLEWDLLRFHKHSDYHPCFFSSQPMTISISAAASIPSI